MKTVVLSLVIVAILIGGAIILSSKDKGASSQAGSNVRVVDGKQIIMINAKGGYLPKVTTAKAGMPTIIKMNTQGAFDCSAALTIPSLGINKNLPPSGETAIDVPTQQEGTTLRGLCAMGMYHFAVHFQ